MLDPIVAATVTLLCGSGLRSQISEGVEEEEAATISKAVATAAVVCVGRRGRWDGKQRGSSGEAGMAGGGGREERNRGGWRRKRRPKKEKAEEGLATVKKGLAAVEAAGKRRRQRGLARVAAAGSSEEAREEGEEGAARATAEEGYGQLDATAVVVEEERRWLPGREGGSEVRRASKGGR
ncbi:hypothetical protein BHM03_00005818 [Ensete ventricosum]|nr:hypothetical protein BHM03_00005818 [Ensete ventricosum]